MIKTSQEKVDKLESDIKLANKASKAKEKEIYNLENKNENQLENIKRLKDKLNKMNIEKSKSEKELKKVKKNLKPELKDQNQNLNPVVKESETKTKTDDDNQDTSPLKPSNSLPAPAVKTSINPTSTESLKQALETETNAKGDHDTKEDELECEVCLEILSCEAELHNHWKVQHGGVNYDCTLCDQIFKIEEDFMQHRSSDGQVKLSKAVVSEFRKQIGDCQDCNIFESTVNTSYSFCENDCHIEAFYTIWNSVKSGSMPN